MRALDAVQPVVAVRPEVLDNFDMDEVVRGLGDAFGLPGRMMRDPRQVSAERQQRAAAAAEAEQHAQLAGAAKPMADAARGVRDLMQAEQMAGGGA